MVKVGDVVRAMERIAPPQYAFEGDKVGLQVGDHAQTVRRGVVALDRSLGAVGFAEARDAQILVTHHPLLYEPLAAATTASHVGKTVLRLAQAGIAFYAAHTNWDSARGGINDALCDLLDIQNARAFGTAAPIRMLKLVFFCPAESVGAVIDAVSEAGAGTIGLYSRCAFMSEGRGTFIGGEGSDPSVGEPGQVEEVAETRVEMVLPEQRARAVASALRRSHPYEEPAFDFLAASPVAEQPAGRVGRLAAPESLASLSAKVQERLETSTATWGLPHREIEVIAVVGGAADGEWREAQREGADAMITGEVRQHVALEASESGFCMIAAGHYATEHPGCAVLRARLEAEMPDVEWLLYEPRPGEAGRPF